MEPITRNEMFMAAAAGEYDGELPTPITRQEQYLKKIIEEIDGGGSVSPEQIDAAIEAYLNSHDADIVTEQELSDELSEYYNKTDIDNALGGKADTGHLHDDRYYTKTEIDTMLNKLESEVAAAATTKRYGVRWLAGNTAAAGTRLDDAVGMAAGVQIGETVNDNDFDSAYPWNSMRRCNGDWNTTTGLFEVMCYEFDTDGVANTAFKTDGSNGNVWVEIPLFWAKHIYDSEKEEKWISNAPGDGYYIPKKLQRSIARGQNKTYIAAYRASEDGNGNLVSVSGAIPAYGNFNTFMGKYKAMGTGTSGTTSEDEEIIDLLMDVEFATRDQQSVMLGETSRYRGNDRKAQISEENTNRIVVANAHAADFNVGDLIGVGKTCDNRNVFDAREITQISQYDTDNTAIEFGGTPVNITAETHCVTAFPNKTGQTDTLTAPSGTVANDGLHDCRYRWIETPYGKQLDIVMDLLINNYQTYFCNDMHGGNYSNQLTDYYIPVGYENAHEYSGYVRNMGFDERYPHIKTPVQIGNSAGSTAGFAAYYYSVTGLCVVGRGGYLNDERRAGRSCSLCHVVPSTDIATRYGSRRSYTA